LVCHMNATKLSDCLAIQQQAPLNNLLNAKVNGTWKAWSTAEVHEKVYSLALGLLALGVSAGDGTTEGRSKIGIISAGKPEWIIVDLAVQLTGAILVPLYTNTNPKEIEEILNEAGVQYLFAGDDALCSLALSVRSGVPSLQQVFSFGNCAGCDCWDALCKPVTEEGRRRVDEASGRISADDVTTIIYTSGTTGHPKGVMLTHRNIVSNVQAAGGILSRIPVPDHRALSFLPLNHIFEKMVMYVYLFNGFSVFFAESMDTIGANMKETGPNIFTAVPRLLEKVFEKIMTEGQKLTGFKRMVFFWAVRVASRYQITGRSPWYNLQRWLADRLVFSKWRKAIGGNVKAIVVGSSACSVKLEKIFTAAGMVIMEGYGLTETSPVISVNHYEPEKRRFGTVGHVLPGVEVMIAPDGEILCKGSNISPGYYRNPQASAEVLSGGWFHTGDIGAMEDGFLRITDRKKEIFKTSGGKYVAPVPIENKMKESLYIEQMMVVGPERKFVSALIVPALTHLRKWCETQQLQFASTDAMLRDRRVIDFYQSIIDRYNAGFNHVEQVKKFVLLPGEWTTESGELTPTGKMKRRIITEKYRQQIEGIYESNGLAAV
jgi:long-chain acyl-CoA synthetase